MVAAPRASASSALCGPPLQILTFRVRKLSPYKGTPRLIAEPDLTVFVLHTLGNPLGFCVAAGPGKVLLLAITVGKPPFVLPTGTTFRPNARHSFVSS